MKLPARGWKSWVLSGAVALPVIAVVWFLFQLPGRRSTGAIPAPTPSTSAGVGFARLDRGATDSLLGQEAMFRDPTPLFLPTNRNATENAMSNHFRRDEGESFQGYASKLTFAEADVSLEFPASVTMPAKPAEAFASDKPERPLIGFGQTDRGAPILAVRRAFLEVQTAGDGQRVLAQALPDAQPPAEVSWQPMEFLLAVNPMGAVRPPVLTESSRVPAVDAYFQEYLLRGLQIGAKLRPGFYRICIGP